MAKKGDFTNPSFVLGNGTELKLNRIKGLLLSAFSGEYRKKHPAPVPPWYEASNGEWFQDATEPNYKKLYDNWTEGLNSELNNWLLKYGVASQPPADYVPDVPMFEDNKLNWLYNIIDNDELSPLINAIMGIEMPTQEGIDDAEKK